MEQLAARTLDLFIPLHIRALKQSEELIRARTLVFLILLQLLAAPGLSAFFHSPHYKPTPGLGIFLVITLSMVGQTIALLTFKLTARHVLSGHMVAFTYYLTAFLTGFSLSGQPLCGFMLHLLALPLLILIIANYGSSLVWLGAVTFAPMFLDMLRPGSLDVLFIQNWITSCIGLFIVMHIINSYIVHLSARLNYQCALFEVAATSDPLTGLANRTVYDARLKESIELCKLHGTKFVLVYIDLDKFKPINDHHGHHAGDIVLVTVADRLLHLVRKTDLVARLGGDEFAIIFDKCSIEEISPLLGRISEVVSKPIHALETSLNVDCSIGVVVCPDDGLDADQLAREADVRMYASKRQARNLLKVVT